MEIHGVELSTSEAEEIAASLLKRERRAARSLAISVASLLHSQMVFIKRPDLADKAQGILEAILRDAT